MKRNLFKHIFFDLDHTLWDFEKSSEETLIELYKDFQLEKRMNAPVELFVETFRKVNFSLWAQLDNREITKKYVREQRFPLVFEKLGANPADSPIGMGEEYLRRCPKKANLIEGTIEVLEYLKDDYQLHILTNGFQDVQHIKMSHSNIDSYFESVVTAECSGFSKPNKSMFDYALNLANAKAEESIMIGDNLNADIKGAIGAGIQAIFFNPDEKDHEEELLADIKNLNQLIDLL
ncbi:YjjG family noncanonical pyrimidine nucleotidase [Sediminitomix flava]|uniref:YjjG family noncanonical pyrimidine nucleotidase n=1 Tax=Sediminitomix flava TaxID=379075 RepID=UPI001304BCA5|nr:YjjG family noncanonical pyrimidine nucleotidase [Sediminitomix flava]